MNTPIKLVGFGVGLAAVFAAAVGVGSALGNPVRSEQAAHDTADGAMDGHDGMDVVDGTDGGVAQDLPGGLMVAQDGYRLVLAADALAAGDGVPLSLQVLDDQGAALTRFEESHTKELHLIVVRRDLTGFQHVHPTRDDSGTWTVPVDLEPGDWRVFADFVPAAGAAPGDALTLGADLHVAGGYEPSALDTESRTAEVDGYTVSLGGILAPGEDSELDLGVSKDGEPVTDLEPYLGAYGHLVALRDGDLAYLHVHPAGEPGDGMTPPGPDVTFYAAVPSAGQYRLFLDFQHEGVVRTAEFTVDTSRVDAAADDPSTSTPGESVEQPRDDHDDDH